MSSEEECPICGEPNLSPITLLCKHKFCYLCIKRAYEDDDRCPYCREMILPSCLLDVKCLSEDRDGWVYSSRSGGWWLYDTIVSNKIEEAYQEYINNGNDTVEIFVMNRPYVIDFRSMMQIPTKSIGTPRCIKRSVNKSEIKGKVGMRW